MLLLPDQLLYAYTQGIFPMAHEDGDIYWYDPDPRAIIPLDDRFHVPRRLARTVARELFEIRVDSAFRQTMEACATPAPDRGTTWISEEILESYLLLHRLGFAHSVEAWQEGRLVGGLYGVALKGLFAGESMFSLKRDASKVALVHLVQRLRRRGFLLLDTQFMTNHLAQFGAVEIPRLQYHQLLARALAQDVDFTETKETGDNDEQE